MNCSVIKTHNYKIKLYIGIKFNQMKDNTNRFKNAKIAIIITTTLSFLLLLSLIPIRIKLGEIMDYYSIFTEGIDNLIIVSAIIQLLWLIAYIVSIVLFIMWFRRSYFNLCQKITYLKHSEGWAAGGWFVPFLNLYVPYQISKSLIEEYKKLLGVPFGDKKYDNLDIFLGIWWAMHIVSGVLRRLSDKFDDETLGDQITSNNLLIFAMLTMSIGGVFLLLTMKSINELETRYSQSLNIDSIEGQHVDIT